MQRTRVLLEQRRTRCHAVRAVQLCVRWRCRAGIRRLVDVHARFNQRTHHRLAAPFSSDAQQRLGILWAHLDYLVDFRARLDQYPYHRLVTVISGNVQWRPALPQSQLGNTVDILFRLD